MSEKPLEQKLIFSIEKRKAIEAISGLAIFCGLGLAVGSFSLAAGLSGLGVEKIPTILGVFGLASAVNIIPSLAINDLASERYYPKPKIK